MNSGRKRGDRNHAADRKFLAWAATADARAIRTKVAQLTRQKDFPTWKRVVLTRALVRLIDREEKV